MWTKEELGFNTKLGVYVSVCDVGMFLLLGLWARLAVKSYLDFEM